MIKKMNKQYSVVIIGGGTIGATGELKKQGNKPTTHAGAFLKNRRARIIGLVEPNKTLHEKIKKITKAPIVIDTNKLLKEKNPDIVIVATPDETHKNIVLLAAQYNPKLILCEKPIATNMRDAKQIIAVCKRKKIKLLINHKRRFDPVLIEVQKEIRKKTFGTIKQARCLYGNGIRNNGTHAIDQLRWYMGEVTAVRAIKNDYGEASHKGDYNVDAMIEFQSGARAMLQSINTRDYYLFEHEYFGTNGAIRLRNLGQTVHSIPRKIKGVFVNAPELNYQKAKKIGNEKRSFMKAMANHVIEVLDGEEKPRCTGEDALKTLLVIEALQRSAEQEGRKIFI